MATGHGADDPLADDLISLGESEDNSEKDNSMAKDTNCYMRDTIMGLHRYLSHCNLLKIQFKKFLI